MRGRSRSTGFVLSDPERSVTAEQQAQQPVCRPPSQSCRGTGIAAIQTSHVQCIVESSTNKDEHHPAGLVSIMAAKAFGAGKVAVVDMNETNLEVTHSVLYILVLLLLLLCALLCGCVAAQPLVSHLPHALSRPHSSCMF